MTADALGRVRALIWSPFERLAHSRIVQDSAALLIADWSTIALGLVTSVVLARALGSQNYGMLVLAAAVVTTLTQFMSIRTGEGLIRFVSGAVARGNRREAISFFYVGVTADALVSLVTVVIALSVIPWWVRAYPNSQSLRELALIYVCSIPFATLEGSFSSVCHVFKQFKLYAGLTILIGLFRVGTLVVLAPLGLRPVMWGYVAVAAFSFLVWLGAGTWLLIKRIGTWWGCGYRSAAGKFASFTFHTGVTASLIAVSKNIDVLVLGALRPVEEVGFYRIAYSAAGLVAAPVAPVNTVLYPEMTEAWTMENVQRVKRLIRQYVLHAVVVTALIYVFLFLTIDWLVLIFYGVAFQTVGNLVRILGVAVLLGGLFHWARQATLAKGKPHLATAYNAAALGLRLALLVPFILAFGVSGAAWAYVIVMLFTVALIRFYVLPRLGL